MPPNLAVLGLPGREVRTVGARGATVSTSTRNSAQLELVLAAPQCGDRTLVSGRLVGKIREIDRNPGEGDGHVLPGRAEGCFAQKVAFTFFARDSLGRETCS